MTSRRVLALAATATAVLALTGLAACDDDDAEAGGATELRLGLFPNITHAPALVGVQNGIFAEKLGSDIKLTTTPFNAGPSAIEALFSGAIDEHPGRRAALLAQGERTEHRHQRWRRRLGDPHPERGDRGVVEMERDRGNAPVRLDGVSKAYGRGRSALLALDRVSLTVRPGEFVSLLGASGRGKSTLLSLVGGLDPISGGSIDTGGHRVSMMFQEPALFPWLTVARNVEIAMRLRGVGRDERQKRAATLLETVRLTGFERKRPHELSGGMRQRVTLARALAQDADLLLMDEPFGALDAMTRDILHDELERIWRERSLTVLFVTHNVREAVRLGDRVILLSSRPGRVPGSSTTHPGWSPGSSSCWSSASWWTSCSTPPTTRYADGGD